MDLFLHAGLAGLLVTLLFAALLLAGVLFVAFTKSPRVARGFVLLALLPMLIGFTGTNVGYRQVDAHVAIVQNPVELKQMHHPQGVIAVGREEARASSIVGLGATLILLLASGAGPLLVGSRASE